VSTPTPGIERQLESAPQPGDRLPAPTVTHNDADGKYEARNDAGELMGWLGYRRNGSTIVTYTTQTLPQFRGQGVASAMAKAVLDDAIADGSTVDAACWYVAEYIQRHPKYQRLTAAEWGF
jgi:predicted GNAT family acetyltransferase